MPKMHVLDQATVKRYIARAEKGRVSPAGRMVLRWCNDLAKQDDPSLKTIPKHDFLTSGTVVAHFKLTGKPPKETSAARTNRKARSLVWHVMRELHLALCKDKPEYRDEVKDLAVSSIPLLTAVAGAVAVAIGWQVAIVTAVVAAVLRLIAKIGRRAFCEWASERWDWGQ